MVAAEAGHARHAHPQDAGPQHVHIRLKADAPYMNRGTEDSVPLCLGVS